jgi:hypothetical protein
MASPDELDEAANDRGFIDFKSLEEHLLSEVTDSARMTPQEYANYIAGEFPDVADARKRKTISSRVIDLYDELRMGERKPIVLEVEPED